MTLCNGLKTNIEGQKVSLDHRGVKSNEQV